MDSLNIRFSQNLDLLAKSIAFTAKSIQIDNFSKGNYVVLPYLVPNKRKAIYFPDLDYTPEFWSELAKVKDYSLTKPYPIHCLEFIKLKLANYKKPKAVDLLVKNWDSNSKTYQNHLQAIFSQKLLEKVKNIEILLTEFGSPGTFSRTNSRIGAINLICTARTDLGPENILQVIVNCLITITQTGYADVGTIGWYQRNAIINYISKYSSLSPLLPGYTEETFSNELLTEGANYVQKLGFPKEGGINIEIIKSYLTPKEKQLITCLSKRPGQIISFDEIAQAIWGDKTDEKFSLYALAKIIESIRQKTKLHGINRELIHTHRKQGYMFIS